MSEKADQTGSTASDTSVGSGRVAFVQACWHKQIVDQCRRGFKEEMARLGYPASAIDEYEVPGSFESPLRAKALAGTGAYAAIVAAGLVVDGGIYRHEFVAGAVIQALMQVQLETGVPVLSAVLIPQRFHEHAEHQRFFHQHFLLKGREAAVACARVIRDCGCA